MSKIRCLIVPVAAWLSLHVSVVAPMTVLMVTPRNAASDIVCICAHGADHGLCPMHGKPVDSARCHLQSTQRDLGGALLSMLSPLTLAATTVDLVQANSARLPKGYDARLPLDSAAPPDAPPPRG